MRNESPDVRPLMTLHHAYHINLFMLEGLALETRMINESRGHRRAHAYRLHIMCFIFVSNEISQAAVVVLRLQRSQPKCTCNSIK